MAVESNMKFTMFFSHFGIWSSVTAVLPSLCGSKPHKYPNAKLFNNITQRATKPDKETVRKMMLKNMFYLMAECIKLFSFSNKKIVLNKTMFEINNSLIASLNVEAKIIICLFITKFIVCFRMLP